MELGTRVGMTRLFMVIAVILIVTLVVGLVGVGGLVFWRVFGTPPQAAAPSPEVVPSQTPFVVDTATPTATAAALPTGTLATAPTATRVVVPSTATQPVVGPGSGAGQQAPAVSGGDQEGPSMPQTGLAPLEALVVGLGLILLLGVARVGRRPSANGSAQRN